MVPHMARIPYDLTITSVDWSLLNAAADLYAQPLDH
jgi:hypothetical protein